MSTAIRLALPTGRIFDETVELLTRSGFALPEDVREARKLHVSNGRDHSSVLVKDRDVPTYVEHGVVDAGIVGNDVLAETNPDVYQPLDLRIGRCQMVVARHQNQRPGGYRDLPLVRVATKYPEVASRYFLAHGIPVEVILLSGSVELAPVLGLADCIVDLVQTGKTMAANGLEIDEVLFESTARLIVNRASFRLKGRVLGEFVSALAREVEP